MIEIAEFPGRFSFSALDKWTTCEKRWELAYLYPTPRRSGWASVGGSAVHLATERWDAWNVSKLFVPEKVSGGADAQTFKKAGRYLP